MVEQGTINVKAHGLFPVDHTSHIFKIYKFKYTPSVSLDKTSAKQTKFLNGAQS